MIYVCFVVTFNFWSHYADTIWAMYFGAVRIGTEPNTHTVKRQNIPVTGLEWPSGFQEVKVARFRDNGTGWW